MSHKKKLHILYMSGDRGLNLNVTEGYLVHVLKIVETLRNSGHAVDLMTVFEHEPPDDIPGYLGIQHKYVKGIHHLLPFTGLLNSIRVFKEIKALHRQRKIDIIHERFGLYSFGGILASRLLKIPLILEINGPAIEEKQMFTNPLAGFQKKVAVFIRKMNLSLSHRIIAVSNILKNIMVERWGIPSRKIDVIPNAADVKQLGNLPAIDEAKKQLGFGNYFVIGYLGTLQVWYAIDTVIDAFNVIHQRIPNARLLIIGDGQAREKLVQQCTEKGLEEKIIFTGKVAHQDVHNYLAAFDVAVAPFRDLPLGFFGSPIKLFEYMAAGRSIVATNIGQISEIVKDGEHALLVRQDDPLMMAEAVLRIAKNSELKEKLVKNAKNLSSDYSWEKYGNKLIDIYRHEIAELERGNRD